jgi:CHAT domain
MKAQHVTSIESEFITLLERIPGDKADKQKFFSDRGITVARTNYETMWTGLSSRLGRADAAKQVFALFQTFATPRVLALIAQSETSLVDLAQSDPVIVETLFFGNGKRRRIAELFVEFLAEQPKVEVVPAPTPAPALPLQERAVVASSAHVPIPEGTDIRILFLSVSPPNWPRLRVDKESREIKERLRASKLRDNFRFDEESAVRVSDLQQHLLRHRPHILHLSGHGTRGGKLVLESDGDRSKAVDPRALHGLFKLFVPPLQVVVMNACYSRNQAEGIAEAVDNVVGMSDSIVDEAAITYAAAFYQALGFGRNVSEAHDLGRNAIALAGLPGKRVPELLSKSAGEHAHALSFGR